MPRTRVSCVEGGSAILSRVPLPGLCQWEAEVSQGSGYGGVLASCLFPAVRPARTPLRPALLTPGPSASPALKGLLVLSLTALGAGL